MPAQSREEYYVGTRLVSTNLLKGVDARTMMEFTANKFTPGLSFIHLLRVLLTSMDHGEL